MSEDKKVTDIKINKINAETFSVYGVDATGFPIPAVRFYADTKSEAELLRAQLRDRYGLEQPNRKITIELDDLTYCLLTERFKDSETTKKTVLWQMMHDLAGTNNSGGSDERAMAWDWFRRSCWEFRPTYEEMRKREK